MKNSILKKIIIIIIAFLMLFSIVGQFMVSALDNEIIENAENEKQILEENKISNDDAFDELTEISDKDLEKEDENTDDEDNIIDEDTDDRNTEVEDNIVGDDSIVDEEIDTNKDENEEIKTDELDKDTINEEDFFVTKPYSVEDVIPEKFNITTNSILKNPEITCDAFELVTITNSGDIKLEKCYTDFNSAKSAMNSHANSTASIRHSASHSPMKFIATKRAILHAVPHRINSVNDSRNADVTMNITDANGTDTSTYISRGFEMAYFGTNTYNTNGTGKVHVGVVGFDGNTNLQQVDIIPMIYVENGLMVEIGGSKAASADFYKKSRLNAKPAQSYYKISTNNANVKEISYISENLHRAPNDANTAHYHASMTIGPATEDWMVNNETYYSWDGVTFYSDRDYKNKVGTYYNYYQFLPLRTKSNISNTEFDNYLNKLGKSNSVMKNLGKDFVNYGKEYGMNPLLVYAMAAHESAWGTSKIAREKFNLFGWNAFDSDPSAATDFPTPGIGVKDHMGVNLRGYLDVTYETKNFVKDWRYFGAHLGNRGTGLNLKYASDPHWGMKIAGIAYRIDASTGLKDFGNYTLGLVTDKKEYLAKKNNIKNTNGTKAGPSDVFYSLESKSGYMENVTITLAEENSTFYKTQTFAAIDNNFNIINIGSNNTTPHFKYNWDKSVGYMKKNKVSIVHKAKQKEPDEETPSPNIKLGDVNGDGIIDILDYVVVANHILKKKALTGNNLKNADINKDGLADILDYVLIANHILGKKLIK